MKPNSNEYGVFYTPYIEKAAHLSIVNALKEGEMALVSAIAMLTNKQAIFRYAEGKWSIKDILLHLVDAERVFCYRALCIAREDRKPLAGFNEDKYVVAANADKRELSNLLDEFKATRLSSLLLFKSFDGGQLKYIGNADGKDISLRALGYIIAGHTFHHVNVIKERYLPSL